MTSNCPSQLPNPPRGFLEILSNINAALAAQPGWDKTVSLSLSANLEPEVTVPLAAFLLEYPIAYVPTSLTQTSFLSGVCLDVYDCTLSCPHHFTDNSTTHSHSFLKFSSPQQLGLENSNLSPATLISKMDTRYKGRLEAIGHARVLKIHHHIASFDRVAL